MRAICLALAVQCMTCIRDSGFGQRSEEEPTTGSPHPGGGEKHSSVCLSGSTDPAHESRTIREGKPFLLPLKHKIQTWSTDLAVSRDITPRMRLNVRSVEMRDKKNKERKKPHPYTIGCYFRLSHDKMGYAICSSYLCTQACQATLTTLSVPLGPLNPQKKARCLAVRRSSRLAHAA